MFSILFRDQLSDPHQTQVVTHNRPAGEYTLRLPSSQAAAQKFFVTVTAKAAFGK